jgi:hypothetical protein
MCSLAPSARTSVFDSIAGIIDTSCKIVFLLIQLELRQHPTNLAYLVAIAGMANHLKNIRIHPAVFHVRLYLLRFNSSGNFCDSVHSQTRDALVGEN